MMNRDELMKLSGTSRMASRKDVVITTS